MGDCWLAWLLARQVVGWFSILHCDQLDRESLDLQGRWLTGWSVGWPVGWLADWPVGWLTSFSIGWLAYGEDGWLAQYYYQ